MNKQEEFALWVAGKMVIAFGFCGAIFTAIFDEIARGTSANFGILQTLGIIVFVSITVYGAWLDQFLSKTVKDYMIVERFRRSI